MANVIEARAQRRTAGCLLALMLLVGCRSADRPRATATPKPPRSTAYQDVTVAESGWAVLGSGGEIVGVTALLRNSGASHIETLHLSLAFHGSTGKRLASTGESLPYCPARSDCWWGAVFPLEQFKIQGADIARVAIAVVGNDGLRDEAPPPAEFPVQREADGSIQGKAPGAPGLVYVIAYQAGQAKAGASVNIEGRGPGQPIRLTSDFFPALGEEESLRAYFYSTPLEEGH